MAFIGVVGDRQPQRVDLTHYRGTYAKGVIKHDLLDSQVDTIVMTWRDASENIVIQLSSTDTPTQLYTNSEDYTIYYELVEDDTQNLSGDDLSLHYDCEIVATDTTVYAPQYGNMQIVTDVTYDSGDAAYVSKTKLNTVEALLAEYAAFWDGALVTTAASSGASEIVVDDATEFSASDTLLISLGQGNGYDSVTIASISTNTINFAPGTLSGNVAVGNPVRIVV